MVAFLFGLGMSLVAVLGIETAAQSISRPTVEKIDKGLQ